MVGDEVEWVQCDKCEGWYHVVCVGISAQDANNIDEYVCPQCDDSPSATQKHTVKEEPMEVDHKLMTSNIQPKLSDLSVMAEVAHQIITADQEKAISTCASNVTSTSQQSQHPPESLDLNSLICLADVSEKIDVGFKTGQAPKEEIHPEDLNPDIEKSN